MLLEGLLALTLSLPTASTDADLPRTWGQPGAGPVRGRRVAVEPIRTEPAELWRSEPVELLAGPVFGPRCVHVVVQGQRKPALRSLDLETGELVAEVALTKAKQPAFELLLGPDGPIVVEAKQTTCFELKGDKLKKAWRSRSGSTGEVFLRGGHLVLTHSNDSLVILELDKGKELDRINNFSLEIVAWHEDFLMAMRSNGPEAQIPGIGYALLSPVLGPEGKQLDLGSLSMVPWQVSTKNLVEQVLEGPWDVSYSGWGHAGNFRGYLRAASGELLFSGSGRWQTLDLDFPAFFDGDAVGASSTGIVRFLREQGARQVLVAPEQVTPASRQVDPTIAQDVAYVGDLAVDLSVEPGVPALLWRLAAEDLDSSLFPAAHRRALYRATDGALVMLAPAQEVPEAPTGS